MFQLCVSSSEVVGVAGGPLLNLTPLIGTKTVLTPSGMIVSGFETSSDSDIYIKPVPLQSLQWFKHVSFRGMVPEMR